MSFQSTVNGGSGKNKTWAFCYSIKLTLLLMGVIGCCLVMFGSENNPLQMMMTMKPLANRYGATNIGSWKMRKPVSELERVLMRASMESKTVIVTALNQAWAEPNSTFDVFLESFRTGSGTQRLLKHVVAACLDAKAFARCSKVHSHCYLLNTTKNEDLSRANSFMTRGYLKLIWRRMEFLREILDLGYNFVFTDADIVWLRDPFPQFFPDADFQIASDFYSGNPYDRKNSVNSGFTYTKANNRTVMFYRHWCDSSKTYPRKHDQDVFNIIKTDPFTLETGIQMRFLDTVYFGGFCEPSKDINVVCTMHANCCVGLDNKVNDLKIVLEDWKKYLSDNVTVTSTKWNIPAKCHVNRRGSTKTVG